MSFKLGLVSISFRKYSPREILIAMNKAGLSLIEWGSDVHCPPEKAEEIALLQKEYNVSCCSYGTYFRIGVNKTEEIYPIIKAAKQLNTNVLRLWCGNKNSEEYSETEKEKLLSDCIALSEIAEENSFVFCLECHNNTFTNNKDFALWLMKEVNSENFRMYWQPNQYKTVSENLAYAELLKNYTLHIHVFNWEGDNRFPLIESEKVWKQYLEKFENNALLLEFMPDDNLDSLLVEASALKKISEE